jgi:hypothetical protein
MCSCCFRAFHELCSKMAMNEFSGEEICVHCQTQMQKKCAICSTLLITHQESKGVEGIPSSKISSINNESMPEFGLLRCSYCYCEVHSSCVQIPLELLKANSYFFQGI